ncbi:hypothetical protein BpHYR1_041864 [Brachionus plicatilis]|uniref:Uncharacterized protein n=1 Tax=Brachionus plicatilis TaxID=10195 RepID=A0A3M7PBM4_BRAPC|nr:hypothetical protein BpHYR1_041864 [Brachionus plicatilis]
MIDLEETFNESSIEYKSLSANEIGIEIKNQINSSNSRNRPNRRKRIYWSFEIIFKNYNEAVKSIEKKMDSPKKLTASKIELKNIKNVPLKLEMSSSNASPLN